MCKALLVTLLAVVSSSAAAEWVRVGSNTTGTMYADPTTIRRAGGRVKMWNLVDFKTLQTDGGDSYLAKKELDEYDCEEEQWRLLYVSRHSENMGGGQVTYSSSSPIDWRPVPPGSGAAILWKIACGEPRRH